MANEPLVTLVGNLTADPELRFISSGVAVVNFTLASTPRTFNKRTDQWEDGDPLFVRCSAWREYAENISNTLAKGMRVIAYGRLTNETYEHNGEQRSSLKLDLEAVGPDLRYATAQVTKAVRGQAGGSSSRVTFDAPQGGTTGDQWAQVTHCSPRTGTSYDDTPPF